MSEPQSPAETAKTEAAKQAVALVFMLAGAAVLMMMQRRLAEATMDQYRELDPSASRRRMERARKAEIRWNVRAGWLWRYGPYKAAKWANDRAEAARKAYEAERP